MRIQGYRPLLVAFCILCAGCSYGGCSRCKGIFGLRKCADIPKGAVPQPHGTFACQWQTAQMARAEQDDFAIYLYEWQGDRAELTRYGNDHLNHIAQRLPEVPFNVVIARSENEALDLTRRRVIVDKLAEAGVGDAELRTVVGQPPAEPLFGAEAPLITRGILGGNQGGFTGGGAGTGGSGSGFGAGFVGGVGAGSAFGGF